MIYSIVHDSDTSMLRELPKLSGLSYFSSTTERAVDGLVEKRNKIMLVRRMHSSANISVLRKTRKLPKTV